MDTMLTHEQDADVMIPASKISERIIAMAAEIDRDYPGGTLYLVCVLKGACLFLADLARAIQRPVRFDFVAVSSYGDGTVTSGEPRLTKDLSADIGGAHVLVVEDIVDTGITLDFLLGRLRERGPKSLEVITLLDKPDRHERDIAMKYIGFTIPNRFVVGYGMDYGENYRALPDVCVLGDT